MKEIKDYLHLEEWRQIIGIDNYEASNLGRVRSKSKSVAHNYGGVALRAGMVMSQYIDSKGYYSVGLTINGVTKIKKVHRLVALAFLKNPQNKPTVNHKDTNKLNNLVSNLEWATQKEQVLHAVKNKCRKSFAISNETKAKIGLSGNKAVTATDIFTNGFIQFKSITDCANHFQCTQPAISKSIKRQSLFARQYKINRI